MLKKEEIFEACKNTINKFSFALIKFKNKEFEYNKEFKCGEANIEILKPNWLN